MWNEPQPKWRTARKQHQCQGDGCDRLIAPGEQYLDRLLLDAAHSHLRYCQECGTYIMPKEDDFHSLNGRNTFPDRYQERISSAEWKKFRATIIEQRGNRCERCQQESASLALHHIHYRSLGCEQTEDVELLCNRCHESTHEECATTGRAKHVEPEEAWIVSPDGGEHWGKLDANTVYVPLENGRYLVVPFKRERGP